MSHTSTVIPSPARPRPVRFHGMGAVMLAAALAFALAGLVYNAVYILRLPQSGLKTFEIVWVSFTACVLVILLALAVAAGLEHLGYWLEPKPQSEEWLREEVRRHRMGGMEVTTPDGGAKPASYAETAIRGHSSC